MSRVALLRRNDLVYGQRGGPRLKNASLQMLPSERNT